MSKQQVIKKSMAMLLTLVILLLVVAPAMAREDRAAQAGNLSTAPAQDQGSTDSAELESFLDELMGRQIEEYHVAGAAVSV